MKKGKKKKKIKEMKMSKSMKKRKRRNRNVGTGNELYGERGVNTRHRARNAYHTTSPFEISLEKESKTNYEPRKRINHPFARLVSRFIVLFSSVLRYFARQRHFLIVLHFYDLTLTQIKLYYIPFLSIFVF